MRTAEARCNTQCACRRTSVTTWHLAVVALLLPGCAGVRAPVRRLPPTPKLSIITQLPSRRDAELTARFDEAYAAVARMFAHEGRPPWPGRCEVYCFQSRSRFEELVERRAQVRPPSRSHAYQIATGSKVTVVIHNPLWFSHDPVYASFAHEVTHAFLTHYAGTGPVPTWVHEGLALHFEFIQPEAKAAALRHRVLAARGSPRERLSALRAVLSAPAIEERDEVSYAMAWRLVQALLDRDAGQFPGFVRDLKGGKTLDEALSARYGWDSPLLVKECVGR